MQTLPRALTAIATACVLAFGAATAQVAIAQVIGAPSATPITTDDCVTAWNAASASSSCTTTVLDAESVPPSTVVNNCAVKADCASTAGGPHDTFSDYHGGPAGVRTLVNCSGQLATDC